MGLRLFDRLDPEGKMSGNGMGARVLGWLSVALHKRLWPNDPPQSICSRAEWKKSDPLWAWWREQIGPMHTAKSYANYWR